MKEALTLQVLKINHCNLGQPALEALCAGLRRNASLKVLDLSYNHMPDRLGGIVARLIKDQGEFRDSQLWVGSLRQHPDSRKRSSSRKGRDEGPTEQERAAKLEGLVEFILHHNCFGTKLMAGLASILQLDRYVRKIDLRNNLVMESDIQGEFLESLRINESVLNFDLRGNPGNTAAMRKQVALCLIKNLEQVKLKNDPIRPSWVELKLLDPENSDLHMLMQGLSIMQD